MRKIEIDKATVFTFLCLGISTIFSLVYDGLKYVPQLIFALGNSYDAMNKWTKDN